MKTDQSCIVTFSLSLKRESGKTGQRDCFEVLTSHHSSLQPRTSSLAISHSTNEVVIIRQITKVENRTEMNHFHDADLLFTVQ